MACQERLLTDAYILGVNLRSTIESDQSLWTALQQLEFQFDLLNNGYPEWHPAPHPFKGMVRLFLYRELTGESYRALTRYPELADVFGLEKIPDESVLSRTWRNRFDDATREFVTTAAHYVVKEIHDRDIHVPEARPKVEVVTKDRARVRSRTIQTRTTHASSLPSRSSGQPDSLVTTASTDSTPVELRTPHTMIRSSSNCRRSRGWSAAARPKAPPGFSIATDRGTVLMATRTSERSNSSSPRRLSRDSTWRPTGCSRLSSPKHPSVDP